MSQKGLNEWTGIGLVGKDPEVRKTQSGTSVTNISLACGRSWKSRATGEREERTDWIPITAWDKLADLVGQYVRKGDLVYCTGSLQFKDEEREGVKFSRGVVVLEDIIFLRSKDRERGSSAPAQTPRGLPTTDDMDIPF